jgi:hypothetical protein
MELEKMAKIKVSIVGAFLLVLVVIGYTPSGEAGGKKITFIDHVDKNEKEMEYLEDPSTGCVYIEDFAGKQMAALSDSHGNQVGCRSGEGISMDEYKKGQETQSIED